MNESNLPPGPDWPEFAPGSVWLCGAGPGDPGLLTLHGLNALRQADVVVHDTWIDPTVLSWARSGADLVPMGKRGGRPSPRQAEVTERLIELARAGERVLRLKSGDPFTFGRGGEEAQELARAGVPFRIIPGVTAGIGGLAYAGIPATHYEVNRTLTFLTGHDAEGGLPDLDWAALARGSEALVIYMGVRNIGAIAEALIAGGRAPDEPVALVSRASMPEQTVVETTLAGVEEAARKAALASPTLVYVGGAVALRPLLDWWPGGAA